MQSNAVFLWVKLLLLIVRNSQDDDQVCIEYWNFLQADFFIVVHCFMSIDQSCSQDDNRYCIEYLDLHTC